MVPGS
jgi:hypothetical protein